MKKIGFAFFHLWRKVFSLLMNGSTHHQHIHCLTCLLFNPATCPFQLIIITLKFFILKFWMSNQSLKRAEQNRIWSDQWSNHLLGVISPSACSEALRLWWICSGEENLLKMDLQTWKAFLKWGYREQQLNSEIQQVLDTPGLFAITTKPEQACSHTIGGYIPSHFTNFTFDHHTPAIYPSYLETSTEGLSASATDCLLLSKEPEGLPGTGKSDSNPTWVARQPSMWGC